MRAEKERKRICAPNKPLEKRQKTRASKTAAVLNFHAPDGSHVFTSFTNDPTLNARKKEEYQDIVNRLLPRQILMPKRVDWDLLRSMHVENDIKAILEKHAYDEDGNEYYICHAWDRVFDIAETLYRELIVEFVATFRFDAIKALGEFHQSCMTFRLGGVWRSLSLVDFALALGIYTQLDVDAPGFEEYMWATAKRPDDFDPRLAWVILGDGDYHGNLKVKGFIASTDRLLHRMLIQAVNARSSSEEKVTVHDLWLLEQLSTDDKYPNAPYLIAAQLAKASGYREGSRIVGGQYVTLLAKHFGILTDTAIASMTNLGEMGLIDMDQLRGMGVARVEHAIGRDYNAWIRNPQAYGSQPRGQPSQAPRSTHGTSGTSGASAKQQPADWTAYSGYQDLSNQLSEMSLSYGRHQQHMEYNTVEALHQANWQSGVMNQMASHFGIQPNTAFAPSPYWPYSEDAPPVWRSPDGAWSFFFKYQPPPSVLDMSFEVRYTRGIQRNESESTKGADTLRKSISDHLSLYFTANLLEPFEEPEREFRKRNKKKSKANKVRPRALIFEMGDEAPMWTARRAAPTVPTNRITKPDLNKEIPGKLLHMIKDLTFDGKNDSNPIVHMENFVDICDLFKTEEGRDDAIRLRVFPLTFTGEARAWLRSLEPSSITTWEGLRSKFLSRFFPPSKIDKLRADIRSFQQDDGETISEAWERFKHLLNSCPSHGLNKSEQVQTFYSGLAYSSRPTLDSSAGGVFMYKTPTEGYKLLEDMLIHNIDWRTDKRLQIPRMAGKISTDFDPSDELAAMKNQQVKFERKIEELIKSVHALQVGCEECNGPHLTKDCPNRPMMTPEEVNYLNQDDYQGRWNNNRNFIPRPPGFFAPNQQNQRPDGEPRVSIEDRIVQFMNMQKKLNDEVSSYLRNHQSTIQNFELQVGRVSQMLSERTQGELPTQTQVNPKVENVKLMLMMTGEPSKKKWTDIYTKKYVDSDSGSEPDYATDYDSEGFTISFEHLGLKEPVVSSDDEEEDGKEGGYAEFMIPKKEDKGKEKEKEKAPEDDLIYIAPIKHDPGSYNLPISCHKFKGLALVDSGVALNMMPVGYCRKMGVKKIMPTDYQYRGVNGYMTKPLGIAKGVPIRIGNFVYYTDFIIANLPQSTEIPIILGRSFLHTA
ncbi:hypothetical protein OSB04_024597 [Centaurea solstitialis]|uniref:Retrotransposon gag domain-containing protein n=1 Tax=Centaurea solstitialis TaxID=347529 RepID=A0AA38SLE9_9ASTR|nr:hypothetical protein OSB04_024597 [Centaurea solstitialis]